MSPRNGLSTVDVASGRFAYHVGTLYGIAYGLWIIHFRVIQESPLQSAAWMQPPLAIPQKAHRGGIPGAVLEPLVRSWSHFVGIYRQKLTKSSKNDF